MNTLKLLTLFSFCVLLVSCGKIQQNTNSSSKVGGKLSSARTLSSLEKQNVGKLCSALKYKRVQLEKNSMDLGPYRFKIEMNTCNNSMLNEFLIMTTIESNTNNYYFSGTNSDMFFPLIETDSHGMLSEICNNQNFNQFVYKSYLVEYAIKSQRSNELTLELSKSYLENKKSSNVFETQKVIVQTKFEVDKPVGMITFREKVSKCFSSTKQTLRVKLD